MIHMWMTGMLCTTGLTHPVETSDCRGFVLSHGAAQPNRHSQSPSAREPREPRSVVVHVVPFSMASAVLPDAFSRLSGVIRRSFAPLSPLDASTS